ncbi:MAG: Gfo/Idh/MocA family protein [Planctomycetaceae bacterium]
MPRFTRRQFLNQTVAGAATAFAAPWVIPSSCFGANERVVTGHIGVGGQGGSNLGAFLKLASPAAVCDVDKTRLAKAVERVEKETQKKCEGFGDYRKLLDRKDIDVIVISTPDHWHALNAIHACQAGKDVYCEKPLSLTIVEGRKMVEAARKNKRVVQTGSQQRSDSRFRQACELVRNGRLGKLERVMVGLPGSNFNAKPVPDSDPPEELDYDMWLGPAPLRPYNVNRVHYKFRFFWDYSGGQMTNFGAHHIDIAQWGLGMDDSGPVATEGTATFHPEKHYEVTQSCRVTHTYANGVILIVGQGEKDCPGGVTFIGSEGTIFVDRGKITSTPAEIVKQPMTDSDERLYVSTNHHQNFLDCLKTRKLPICDVEIGHRAATICHLGNIALRLGRRIQWNPATEQIVGDDEAAKWVSRPYRAPWTLS